ncbi:MAG TPA: hypothetical protein VH165_02000 [Kofleriaceae bacterium]|nr:hypothetical protein [Kofleriaceae bacterium]
MSARAASIAAVPALVLAGIACWEVCAARRDATSVPGDAAWQAAAAAVRAGYRPGDLIVFAPAWVDPIGRRELGDLIALPDAARMDAARYGRIWELAIRGAQASDTADLVPAVTEDHAGVRVRRYDRPPAVVVGDVLDRAASATLSAPPPATLPATPPGPGAHPAVVLAEVGFAPHRCVQVSPAPGTPLRITFPAFPLGRTLVGYVGIADVFTRRDVRSPVRIDVELAGRVIASAGAGVDDGWVRFTATTPPGPADVTFVARAADANRKLCFAAEARQ